MADRTNPAVLARTKPRTSSIRYLYNEWLARTWWGRVKLAVTAAVLAQLLPAAALLFVAVLGGNEARQWLPPTYTFERSDA
jgi:hypothetical protein